MSLQIKKLKPLPFEYDKLIHLLLNIVKLHKYTLIVITKK